MEKKPSKNTTRTEVQIEADRIAMSQAAAERLIETARRAAGEAGRVTVALSGGNTPRVLHKILSEKFFSSRMPWDRTHIFWVDERCVPMEDLSSNYGTLERDLLSRIPIPRENIHPMPGDLDPDEGALRYQETLVDFFQLKEGGFPAFDMVFLGIGRDGHTASIFPGQAALEENEKLVLHVKGGDPFVDRITLTLPVLNRGREIIFLVSGKGKAEIMRGILKGGPDDTPAARVEPVFGRLTWILDLSAATLLS